MIVVFYLDLFYVYINIEHIQNEIIIFVDIFITNSIKFKDWKEGCLWNETNKGWSGIKIAGQTIFVARELVE